ncbi:MAG: SLATT domain-containing protein [Mesorhizobium sp.]|nr:MAG: SLATT domain-containing protein [Mesorhizobium sp.]
MRRSIGTCGGHIMGEENVRGVLSALDELREDSKLSKSKHFSAAARKLIWHRMIGVPVIVINLLLSLVITKVGDVEGELPWLSMAALFCTFSAASLSAVQTFFNFQNAAEGHRSIGNRYLWVSRQCKSAINRQLDIPASAEVLWKQYEEILNSYQQINIDAEAFPTGTRDLKLARSNPEITDYKNPHPA